MEEYLLGSCTIASMIPGINRALSCRRIVSVKGLDLYGAEQECKVAVADTRERAQSFLTDDHLDRIVKAYKQFKDEPGFTSVATMEEIRSKGCNLSIPLYVTSDAASPQNGGRVPASQPALHETLGDWLESSKQMRQSLTDLIKH